MGSKVAKAKGFKVGDTFIGAHGIEAASHQHDQHAFQVVGILAPSNNVLDRLIVTSVESVWYAHDEEIGSEN